jgi:hypothetical protein
MMDASIVSVIVERMIKTLESEKVLLERKLEAMKQKHGSSWEMYGSELCSGDMIAKEMAIREKINKIDGDLKLMKGVISTKLDEEFIRSSEKIQLQEIAEHNKNIDEIIERRKSNEQLLEAVKTMKTLLQIS